MAVYTDQFVPASATLTLKLADSDDKSSIKYINPGTDDTLLEPQTVINAVNAVFAIAGRQVTLDSNAKYVVTNVIPKET